MFLAPPIMFIIFYAPPIGGALIDTFVWRLTSVCLTVAYIGPKSRTERPQDQNGHRGSPRHTWLGHHFKVKRSKVKVTRPLWFVVLAGQHGHTVMAVTYPYAYMTYIVSPGLGGAYRGGRPPTACFCIFFNNLYSPNTR